MQVKLSAGVRLRKDDFGGVCYVPHRDDFFAIDSAVFAFLGKIGRDFAEVAKHDEKAVRELANLGILTTKSPKVVEKRYSGPAFIGDFQELVTIAEPLVINCFATSFCPLACIYCHADDLMKERRSEESNNDISQVIATATSIPALVAVITGGDPLTRPDRAIPMIQELSKSKAIVLDTSGAGDLAKILPVLVAHQVHVRISIDAITATNDELRPINPKIFGQRGSAFAAAEATLDSCLAAGLSITVQTVLTARNDQLGSLRQLRDWLVEKKVKNWVLHIAVEGGSARDYEKEVRRQKRPLSLIPGRPHIHETIRQLMKEAAELIDIRCTDTGSTPNSVLLVDSKGDLYTEGLAKHGKVKLYDAGIGRPDELKKHWSYVDRFGHARRYLNWNPWLFVDQNLEDLTVKVPVSVIKAEPPGFVETEAKYPVLDAVAFRMHLVKLGATVGAPILQRDEYFDSDGRALDAHDFVVRLRYIDDDTLVAIKGRRFDSAKFDISRIELEFNARSRNEVQELLRTKDLHVTWFFEKRRESFCVPELAIKVELDEVPEIGWFVEFEGQLNVIRSAEEQFQAFLGPKERNNYKELFVLHKTSQGTPEAEILGAEF
jgi:predicted adenylyl cyclase CyaB